MLKSIFLFNREIKVLSQLQGIEGIQKISKIVVRL